jgi:hypothetical protein
LTAIVQLRRLNKEGGGILIGMQDNENGSIQRKLTITKFE